MVLALHLQLQQSGDLVYGSAVVLNFPLESWDFGGQDFFLSLQNFLGFCQTLLNLSPIGRVVVWMAVISLCGLGIGKAFAMLFELSVDLLDSKLCLIACPLPEKCDLRVAFDLTQFPS